MTNATKTSATAQSEIGQPLAPAEIDAVSGALGSSLIVGFSVENQEAIALSHKLSEMLKSRQGDALAQKIEDRFHL